MVTSQGVQSVRLRGFSPRGAQISVKNDLTEGQDVCFSKGKAFIAARVAWCKNGLAGLQFYRAITLSEEQAISRSAPSLPDRGFE